MLRAKRTLAALLVTAMVTAPGVALAETNPADPAPAPVTLPAPAPAPAPDAKPQEGLMEAKLSKADAIAAAKAVFTIPADMNEPNANLSQSKTGATWWLEWTTSSKNPNRVGISVEVNAITGAIVRYSRSESQPGDAAALNYSRSQAYTMAGEWLDKLASSFKASLRYVDDPLAYGFYGNATSYRFHWDRMEQGYPVSGEGVDIVIDARSGALQSFGFNWNTVRSFTLPEKLMDSAAAEAAYRQLGLQLWFQRYTKPGTDDGDWRLVYKPYGGYFPSLTQDGKLIDYSGKPIDYEKLMNLQKVPALEKLWAKPAKALTRDEALAIARAVTKRQEQPSNMNCNEYGEETKTQACTFTWSKEGDPNNPSVQIDLQTGLVINYFNWGPYEPAKEGVEAKYSEQQARDIALAFLKEFRPDLAGNALLMPVEVRARDAKQIYSYGISFQPLYNGVLVAGGGGNLEIDAMTGEIRYFYGNQTPAPTEKEPFPAADGLLKPDQAMASFLEHKGLEQTWITVYEPGQSSEKPLPGYIEAGMGGEPKYALVWAPRPIFPLEALDAKSGALYDWGGRDLVQASIRPKDIEGHFAQREIELLWARGIFELKDGKFNPADTVSAAELSRWLVLARGMQPFYAYDYALNFSGRGAVAEKMATNAAAPYIGAALQAGILLPEDFDINSDPDAPVTREVFALWVARALGYGDIAKMENRIDMPYADKDQIGAKYANAAAILWGLKISRGDGVSFAPQRQITRGEAAKMLFAVATKGNVIWK